MRTFAPIHLRRMWGRKEPQPALPLSISSPDNRTVQNTILLTGLFALVRALSVSISHPAGRQAVGEPSPCPVSTIYLIDRAPHFIWMCCPFLCDGNRYSRCHLLFFQRSCIVVLSWMSTYWLALMQWKPVPIITRTDEEKTTTTMKEYCDGMLMVMKRAKGRAHRQHCLIDW